MTILFYRYGSICEPAIIQTFRQNGLTVVEIDDEITNKKIQASKRVEIIHNHISQYQPLFVFSINFFPSIADICRIHNMLYLCWTVDSPVLELFSNSIQHNTNRIFMFDGAQYEYFSSYNPENIFHLPLAADVPHYNNVISSITPTDRETYATDISFVGSLYNEKSVYPYLPLSRKDREICDQLLSARTPLSGLYQTEDALTPQIVTAFKKADDSFYTLPDAFTDTDAFVAANYYLGMELSSRDRISLLGSLSEEFDVHLFTRSDTSSLPKVHCHGGVSTHREMPFVFQQSKINLNITMCSIQTGLSQRIYDILGCGGFLLTNYQGEIPEYFEIGKDLDCYESIAECHEKIAHYLANEDLRMEIANNGYQKVKAMHTYQIRIARILKIILASV